MSAAADKAVAHVIGRMKADPRLAYLLGWGSESFDLITTAHAEATNRDVHVLRAELDKVKTERVYTAEQVKRYADLTADQMKALQS